MDFATLHRQHVSGLQRRTSAVLEEQGFSAVVFHSGTPAKRCQPDDQYWPLRALPAFQYWAPLAEPGCAVVVQPGKRPRLVHLAEDQFWEAPAEVEHGWLWDSFDVVTIDARSKGREHVPQGRTAFIGDDDAAAAEWGIAPDALNPPALVAALDALRVSKTPYEVACLAEANRRAAAGHDELRRLFAGADHSELELHLRFLGATRQDDMETPYKNIVALGKHAATLHHIAYEKRAQPAMSMLVDAGANFAGFGSDVTRTWVKGSGAGASAFQGLLAQMEAMQQRLCARVAIGMPYEALHDESHRELAAVLRETGIARLPADELVSRGITRAFYPHGLGHALGLQTHDVGCAAVKPRPDNPFLRNTTVIARDQVFTIEPGVYFMDALLAPFRSEPGIDWKLVAALAEFGGIRIEDDVLVLDRGIRNFTREVLPQGGGPAALGA